MSSTRMTRIVMNMLTAGMLLVGGFWSCGSEHHEETSAADFASDTGAWSDEGIDVDIPAQDTMPAPDLSADTYNPSLDSGTPADVDDDAALGDGSDGMIDTAESLVDSSPEDADEGQSDAVLMDSEEADCPTCEDSDDALLSECGNGTCEPDEHSDTCPQDCSPAGDGDEDGIDDGLEMTLAEAYFPFYSIAPDDQCPLHGVLFRLTPHPGDSSLVFIWYDILFQQDCGSLGHVGDNEVFGAVIDPAVPPPGGIRALRAISHQGTICEAVTTCGSLSNCEPCEVAQKNGASYPVVYASVNKHGSYVWESQCDWSVICDFGGCTLAQTMETPPMVNAGEPDHPLVLDLTTQGFITPANGWTEESLMHFNPWGTQDFGGAGNIADDLQDEQFIVVITGC